MPEYSKKIGRYSQSVKTVHGYFSNMTGKCFALSFHYCFKELASKKLGELKSYGGMQNYFDEKCISLKYLEN